MVFGEYCITKLIREELQIVSKSSNNPEPRVHCSFLNKAEFKLSGRSDKGQQRPRYKQTLEELNRTELLVKNYMYTLTRITVFIFDFVPNLVQDTWQLSC